MTSRMYNIESILASLYNRFQDQPFPQGVYIALMAKITQASPAILKTYREQMKGTYITAKGILELGMFRLTEEGIRIAKQALARVQAAEHPQTPPEGGGEQAPSSSLITIELTKEEYSELVVVVCGEIAMTKGAIKEGKDLSRWLEKLEKLKEKIGKKLKLQVVSE